ncbi:MAG: acyltransferase [Chitinophagaceae bacterium]|nr:acyltransferase [Chitinophagaceae bacterium]
MANLRKLIRYDLPLHIVLRLTNWLPDNVSVIRLRGRLAAPFFKSCGKRLGLGRNITFYNPSGLDIGDDVYIAYGCWFNATGGIQIADEVLFGPYGVVVTSNHTKTAHSYRFGPSRIEPITIGKGSWIAAHVTILAGVNIGEGVLVAANSVVNKSVVNHQIVGGVPAKVLRDENNEK